MQNRSVRQPYIRVAGGVTAPAGFRAWGTAAGIKDSKLADVGVLTSDAACTACGMFTTNAVRAACVERNAAALPSRSIRAICCNSGNANACTGKRGMRDADTTAAALARLIDAKPGDVLVASTGVIGRFLPMNKLLAGIRACEKRLSQGGGSRFVRAIMTTDTVPKQYAIRVRLSRGTVVIGGCAKGSGMICPDMATMLCFITTDAGIGCNVFYRMLRRTVDRTFNNLTVDGDMSTNDMVLALANGMSGTAIAGGKDIKIFEAALYEVCNELCAKIAEDGEGATKRIEISVTGGASYGDCRKAAKAIANSNLVKTAMFGNDPNWGRILCAIGYSGARFSEQNIKVSLCGTPVFARMRPCRFSAASLSKKLRASIVTIDVDLGMGQQTCAVAHTCDFSYDYIKINAEYHT